MTKIATSIRQTIRNSNSFRAIVLGVSGNTATVRVSGVGAKYSNLEVIGGPVLVGEWVTVDFATDVPKIIAPTKAPVKINQPATMSRAQLGSSSSTTGTSGSGGTASSGEVIIFGSDGAVKARYGTNLQSAIAAAVAGDSIYIPGGDYDAGSATLPEGVCIFGLSRYGSHVVSSGLVFSDNCSAEMITIDGPISVSDTVSFDSCDFNSDTNCMVPASGASFSAKECYFRGDYGINADTNGSGVLTSCYFDCTTWDISSLGGFTIDLSSCSYEKYQGDISLLSGDKAAYDTTYNANLHSRDIAEGTYTYHLPPPGSMGEVAMSDGSKWTTQELVPEALQLHAPSHGSGGSDELVYIGATAPAVTFAGKLWCDTSGD